jgi:Cupin domain
VIQRRTGRAAGAHDGFDEAIYVLSGRLLVLGDDEPQEAPPGSTFVAPRGHRHGFRNPSGEAAQVPGLWAPPEASLAFMRDIYARHASRLLPGHLPVAARAYLSRHQATPPTRS